MNNAIELFQKAGARLKHVNEELNRPEEDVMAFAICHQTKTIIHDFLNSHLLSNGKEKTEFANTEILKSVCCEVDDRFNNHDFSVLKCYGSNSHAMEEYCLHLDHVKSCLSLANQLHEVMVGKMEQK